MRPKLLPTTNYRLQTKYGFTLIELLVVIMVLALLYAFVVLAIKPDELKQRTRDAVRISDVNKITAALEAFVSDRGRLPDTLGVTRTSSISVGSGPVAKSNGQGWIGEDMSKYLEKLPIDPVNSDSYLYRYRQSGSKYEVDTRLEFYSALSNSDGGNDSSRYERGTDLTIL